MKKSISWLSDSLDMLLDTMCNTFGGVCFIALMIALISASLPSSKAEDGDEPQIDEQMLVDKETARLTRQRDELRSAIEIQKSFISSNSVKIVSASDLARAVASNETALAKFRAEKLELEDKLAKLTTDSKYSKREADRLSRLLKDMEERLGKPLNTKNRAVRTPRERELRDYRPVTVAIRHGRIYRLDNERHATITERRGQRGLEWDIALKLGQGDLMTDEYFHSADYRALIAFIGEKRYMRIFADDDSFSQMCELRDDLIRKRLMYNWYYSNDDVLKFVEGVDGNVQ